MMKSIGVLHPGEMGTSVAVSAIQSGYKVYWSSENRSEKTHARASQHGLIETTSLAELCQTHEILISVCPPHAAENVAKQVIDCGFKGFYLEANAISPQRAIKIGQMMESSGIDFVDGGIIGGPAWKPKGTWLYLSGKKVNIFTSIFSKGMVETKVIGEEIGKASALKMCYAAYSKGITALLCAVLGTADALGVRDELYQHWDIDETGFSEQVNRRVRRVTAKAWRFEGEMEEIASTFRSAGLPSGFHEAAAEIYHHLADFKDVPETPSLEDVLQAMLHT
jgi:3-hydroxyisobutyrate dehydrogenase-like beta-hydroxyacid dehydrogenase